MTRSRYAGLHHVRVMRQVALFACESIDEFSKSFWRADTSMDSPTGQSVSSDILSQDESTAVVSGQGQSELSSLLDNLSDSASQEQVGQLHIRPFETNRLVQVRLGIASGLFTALRHKDPSTAQHSLRVALCCSSWASWLQLDTQLQDALELAALLHDIGKIGVPDAVLRKPGPLDSAETAVMERHRVADLEILMSCCARPEVLEIVAHAAAWYDGSRPKSCPVGDDIPFGARMLAIADAFDAMLSAQVYRRAVPRERALLELERYSSRQFDPQLVRRFTKYQASKSVKAQSDVAREWLTTLDSEMVNSNWKLNPGSQVREDQTDSLFQRRLLENMHDAVISIDSSLRIVQWNAGAERLTGISGASALQRNWLPSMVLMRNERSRVIADADCPVKYAIRSKVQWLRRMSIRGRDQAALVVNVHAVPVLADDGNVHGVTLIMHDVSQETSLEERCQDLHELATKDPLTQLANRAEFDRLLELFVAVHLERRLACSLIICDIDHFKLVNDNYGHQAGDAVIQSFAKILMGGCRTGDLAARYGGEEFVLLCASCDTETAARRAEKLRSTFGEITHSQLKSESVTASFGVTSVQAGDTSETMLRRADRALLMAKNDGRNQVIQLGTGIEPKAPQPRRRWWCWWQKSNDDSHQRFIVQFLTTEVPLQVTVEKLRGFISDHHAEVVSIDQSAVRINLVDESEAESRRLSDRPLKFQMDLTFAANCNRETETGNTPGTRIRVAINPQKSRDRRRSDAAERARRLLVSLQAYLMADLADCDESDSRGALGRAKHLFIPERAKNEDGAADN